MSSGSKFSRATGRGQFRPPQNRGIVPLRHGPASSKRTLLGQGKDAAGSVSAGNGGITNSSQEESYQLLAHPGTTGRPFAMMIRLQPEILEELKQAEVEGNAPMMKFGANAGGHVIRIGLETFKFSSAPEPGDLCDIYEQKKGENGETLLIEAGSAWRKLSVQRILSATEKDRVKKRTAEAEKKQRLRKSILVDPSTQMIIPQAAAAESNGRKPLLKMTKEPPPKKRKVTMSPIPLAPKQRLHSNATPVIGNHRIASPASPSFEPPIAGMRGTHATQMGVMHPPKGRTVLERTVGPLANKGPPIQKDRTRTPAATAGADSGKTGSAANLTDLRNFLIALLLENPKGVTIKAVEKAVAEGLPVNTEKKVIEKVIKSIATYHAPGKYLLNSGVEKGSFFDMVTPSSSCRAQETAGPITQEDEPSAIIPHREAIKEKKELASSLNRELPNVLPQHSPYSSAKEASPELIGTQVYDLKKNQENLSKQDAAHASKDASTEGSDSSSSSGSGSASDSESDSSGSGSGSGSGSDSGSGSGSDSDASSSSSGASMDEDVDIMSDNDAENKSDTKQKPKMKEAKSVIKEDVKVQENILSREETRGKSISENFSSHLFEPEPTLDHANNCEPDSMAGLPDNLIESVFGPEEESVPARDAGLRQSSEPKNSSSTFRKHARGGNLESSEDKTVIINRGEKKASSLRAQNSKEQRERNGFDQSCKSGTRDCGALGIAEELDILVEKISESKDVANGSMTGNKIGLNVAQQEHHKLPLKSVGVATSKDTDKQLMRLEMDFNSLVETDNKREYSNCTMSDDKLSSKNFSLSLEASKMPLEGSPMGARDSLQNKARAPFEESSVMKLSLKQQSSAEARRPKSINTRESYEKHGRAKVSSRITVRGKSPGDVAKVSYGAAKATEGTTRLDEERGMSTDRISDQVFKGTAEQSDLSEGILKKERVREERMSEATKLGETLGRQIKELEAQHRLQKDALVHGGASRVNAHRAPKDLDQPGGGHDRDSPHVARSNKEPPKVLRPSRPTVESYERARLNVEQAERPLKDVDSAKRGKDLNVKGILKEAESSGRLPSGEPSNLLSKEVGHMEMAHGDAGRSSYSHSRNHIHESGRIPSQDFELGELRDPSFENGPFEGRRSHSRVEDARGKATSEATSRAMLKRGSSSPDLDDLQATGRRLADSSKHSPVKVVDDPRQYMHDLRSMKRMSEENESAEAERPSKKRVGAVQIRQLQYSKQEWLSAGCTRENHMEKERFSASDLQEYAAGSNKNVALENDNRSDEELGDSKGLAYSKQKVSQVPASSSGMRRDNSRAEYLPDTAKRQTPQSSEVQGDEFFAPYEKKKPDFRGAIHSFEEYKEYCKEYHEKYPIYIQLNEAIEKHKKGFEYLGKDIEQAKCKDDAKKLTHTYGKVKKRYILHRKRCKRMGHTFRILHEELKTIKSRCKEYAEVVGQG